jgi:hypothetical protein
MTGLPDITVLQPKNPTNIIIETDNFVWRISSTFVRVEIVAHNELVCKELSLIAQCKAKVTNRISGAIGSVLASIVIDRHYLRLFVEAHVLFTFFVFVCA